MPRLMTSVATRTWILPARNFSRALSRAPCGRSACMTSTLTPAFLRSLHTSSTRCLVRQKTSTRSGANLSRSASSSWVFWPWVTGHRCSSTVSAVSPVRAISTVTGSVRSASMVDLIDGGIVAEKSSVWCADGSSCMMRRMLGQKPMSSMRSASSSTRVSTCERLTWLCSIRSSRRPGVATSMSQPRSSSAICLSNLVPPTTMVARWPVWAHTTLATLSICCASSRVGVTTRAKGPRRLFVARSVPSSPAMRCSVGSVNAAVLPVPVWAEATTSRPSSTRGMAPAWTGVGSVKPSASTPASICSLRPSLPNSLSIPASMPYTQVAGASARE